MNKKGFTLVEVIGVLTLLTLVVLVAFPSILGAMNRTETQMNEATTTLLITNAKSYWNDNVIMKNGTEYCVTVKKLIKQGYTKTPISTVDDDYEEQLENNYCVKANYNSSKWNYSLTNSCGSC